MNGGLKELLPDNRDIQLGFLTKLPPLSDLPETFNLGEIEIKDQGETDYCTAYATCYASEFQEKTELLPEWSFAVSKHISGDVDEWGQDLRTACKSHQKYGAIEKREIPENERYLSSWPDLFSQAIKHKKRSYTKITGHYDHYDNIRASIYYFRNEKRAIVLGVEWGWPLDQEIIDDIKPGFGHALCAIGWSRTGLIVLNSAGKEAGNKGIHIITRNVINYYVDKYGAFMFIDYTPDSLRYMIYNKIELRDNWVIQLFKAVKVFIFG